MQESLENKENYMNKLKSENRLLSILIYLILFIYLFISLGISEKSGRNLKKELRSTGLTWNNYSQKEKSLSKKTK